MDENYSAQKEVLKYLMAGYRNRYNVPLSVNVVGKSGQGMSASALNLVKDWEQYLKFQNCRVSSGGRKKYR